MGQLLLQVLLLQVQQLLVLPWLLAVLQVLALLVLMWLLDSLQLLPPMPLRQPA